jgi:hypothetical protein
MVSQDNQEAGKLLDLFSKISYKGEKVNLDYGTVSLKSLMPSKNYFEIFLNFEKKTFLRGYAELLYI